MSSWKYLWHLANGEGLRLQTEPWALGTVNVLLLGLWGWPAVDVAGSFWFVLSSAHAGPRDELNELTAH